MDLGSLLEPTENAPPTGVDLDAAGDILNLDMLAKWSAPEEEPDWNELQSACLDALEKSRDLRPAVYLTAALLHTQGVTGLAEGVQLLRGLLESQWDNVFPQLDEDGDAMERSSALFNLTNYYRVLKPLRQTPIVEDRAVGRYSLLDIEIAEGKAEKPDDYEGDAPNTGLIQAAFQATDKDRLEELSGSVSQTMADLDAMETLFREKSGAEQAPEFSRLKEGLQRITVALRTYMPEGTMADTEKQTPPGPSETREPEPVPRAPAANGEIRSRQDAVAAMDSVARYFRSHEPSSPVPLLMERAKRLVDMDFLAILQDVAPDAVAQVQRLRGSDSGE